MQAVAAVPAARAAAADRGRLAIADRVFARIAGRVAREALADVWAGRSGTGAEPRVTVSSSRSRTRLIIGLDLPFPADLAALARRTQTAVSRQVADLTGTEIDAVTVVVERLVTEEPAR